MGERTCLHCGQPGGEGDRELRPYGPGGADVCAGCVFDGKHPEREAEAARQLEKLFNAPGSFVFVSAPDQQGVRPMTEEDRELYLQNRGENGRDTHH